MALTIPTISWEAKVLSTTPYKVNVASGSIAANVEYIVDNVDGSYITYNSTDYYDDDSFTGISSIDTYTESGTSNVYTKYQYITKVQSMNVNDPGYETLAVGYYIVDYIGYIYEIKEINYGGDSMTIRVQDLLSDDNCYGPYQGRNCFIYESLSKAALVSQAKLNRLDQSAEDFVRSLSLDPEILDDIEYIDFNLSPSSDPATQGRLQWNADEGTLDIGQQNGVVNQIGQELSVLCKNQTGSQIDDGTPVMFAGAVGASGRVKIMPAIADGTYLAGYTIGMTTEDIANGDDGHVTWFGKIRNIDTTGTPYSETWNDGDIIYISPDTAGYLTNTAPSAPDLRITLGVVVNAASNGTMFVRPTWRGKVMQLDDVDGGNPDTNGQTLVWNEDTQYFSTSNALNHSSHYTGFPNRTDTSLSWDNGTYTLTLSDDSNGTVWVDGIEYTLGGDLTCQLSGAQEAVSDLYWFWITAPSGVLQLNVSSTAPGFDKCLVATVYWNTTTSQGLGGDERHWFGRDQKMHEYLHETFGARYHTGMAGSFTDTTFSIEAGEFYDEDIEHINTTVTECRVMYHDGSDEWEWVNASTTPYKVVNPGIDDTLQYNDGTTLSNVSNNRYVNYWVFITNNINYPVAVFIGTDDYTNLADAEAENVPSLGELPTAEAKLIYQLTFKNSGSSPALQSVTDYRTSQVSANSGYVPSDHGALAGLSDDDHTQYALLTGRSGDTLLIDDLLEYTIDHGIEVEGVTLKDSGITLGTGATVDTIETLLTDDDTHLPTSGAVYDIIDSHTHLYSDITNFSTGVSTYETSHSNVVTKSGSSATGKVALWSSAGNAIEAASNFTYSATSTNLSSTNVNISGDNQISLGTPDFEVLGSSGGLILALKSSTYTFNIGDIDAEYLGNYLHIRSDTGFKEFYYYDGTTAQDIYHEGNLTTFTSSVDGLVPASGGGTTNFLRADGTWATPGGGGTVTSVAAGNGMNFTTITGSGSVTMGTPSTLTASTSNATTSTSHTHEVTGFLTGNETITLTGDVTGSGTTSITTALQANTVGLTELSATGTPSSSTYLRGDNTWATVSNYTFTNGLTESAGTVKLGGTLTENTSIDGNYNLSMGSSTPLNVIALTANSSVELYADPGSGANSNVTLSTSTATMYFQDASADQQTIQFTVAGGMLVTDTINSKGFQYAADYSAANSSNDRWLVDKKYVDDQVSGSSGLWSEGASNKIYYNTAEVGVGTSSPSERLEVYNGHLLVSAGGGVDSSIKFEDSIGTERGSIYAASSELKIVGSNNIQILNTSGYTYFDTFPRTPSSAPTSDYQVANKKYVDDTSSSASTVTLTATNTTNSTHYPLFAEAATGTEEVRTDTGYTYNPSTGVVTAVNFALSSDIRLKDNINYLNDEIITFNYKDKDISRKRYGVIAQDLEKTHPEMVYENEEGYKQVSYTDYLLNKIVELETRIKQLENNG